MELGGRRALIAAGVAVVIVAAAGVATAIGFPAAPRSQAATWPADGHSTATLHIVSGTRLLSLHVANLGGTSGTLLRAVTPDGAPTPRLRGVATVGTDRSGQNELIFLSASSGAAPVTVTLNAAVSWRLDFAAGTERTVANLRGGRVAAITVTAGSDIVDLTLPRPRAGAGTVPIQLTGGASQFLLSLPAGVPVRVTAGGGAGEVSLDGSAHNGVAGGSVFATPGWGAGVPGFDVDATAGVSLVSVTRWGG